MTEIIKFVLLLECMVLVLSSSGKVEEPEKGIYYYDQDVEHPDADGREEVVDLIPIMARRNDFFLKASKSVPRIGRRNDFFYAKTHKSVPRIGRRNDFFLKASKSIPRIGRRDDFTTQAEKESMVAWPWFRDHDFIPRVFKKESFESPQDKNKEIPESRQQPLV